MGCSPIFPDCAAEVLGQVEYNYWEIWRGLGSALYRAMMLVVNLFSDPPLVDDGCAPIAWHALYDGGARARRASKPGELPLAEFLIMTLVVVLTIARVVSIKVVGRKGTRFAHGGKCVTLIRGSC
jgi:hypothetical protein